MTRPGEQQKAQRQYFVLSQHTYCYGGGGPQKTLRYPRSREDGKHSGDDIEDLQFMATILVIFLDSFFEILFRRRLIF